MTEIKKNTTKKTSKALPYDIPVEGSLGLLALGARGVIEWRKVRQANEKANTKANIKDKEEKEKKGE